MGRLTFETPAAFLDARALVGRTIGAVKPHIAQLITVQLGECETFGVRLDGRLVAVLFFLEHADRDANGRVVVETGFAADRTANAHVREALAFTRLILARLLQDDTVAIRASVRVDNPAGHRIARLLGFQPAGVELGMQTYRKVRDHDGSVRRRRCREKAGGAASRAKPAGPGEVRTGYAGQGTRHGHDDGRPGQDAARPPAPDGR